MEAGISVETWWMWEYFVVMNISSRDSPLSLMAIPTSFSFPYSCAVSDEMQQAKRSRHWNLSLTDMVEAH